MATGGIQQPFANSIAELALGRTGYGGALQLTSSGDLLKVVDTDDDPAATRQRLARVILTNPRLFDAAGNPVSRPDDIFNPAFGSGVRALVGEPLTPALVGDLQARIVDALLTDTAVAQAPAPAVDVQADTGGNGLLFVTVTCYTITGQIVTIPNLALQAFTS